MLTPNQLDALPENLIRLYAQLESDIIAAMAVRISAMDYFIDAAYWQYQKAIEMGLLHDEIMELLSGATGKTRKEIESMMREAGKKSIESDDKIYRRLGLHPTPLDASWNLREVLQAGVEKTDGIFKNLTGTTANTATKQFEDAIDRAYMQITSGAFSTQEAVRFAVDDLASKGVETIRYPSGKIDHMDVAVRRAAVTGVNQTSLRLQDARAEEMGSDLVEVTAHAGARTGTGVANHAEWQGKVYSRSGESKKYPGLVESTGYGTGPGLGGWNCRHNMYPYFEKISEPEYTPEELSEMRDKRYEYNGEKMTEEETVKKQRGLERNIRRYKREVAAKSAAGLPTEDAKSKLSIWQSRQKDFLSQTGLKRQYDRERIPRSKKEIR